MELTQLLPGPKGAREASRSFKRVGNRATCPLWRVSGLKGGLEIKFGQEVEVYSQTASADWPWPGIVVPVGGVGVQFPL